MKHNKMLFLFPAVLSVMMSVLIFYSCYPGVGPAGHLNDNPAAIEGEVISVTGSNGRTSVIMPKDSSYPISAKVTNGGREISADITWTVSNPGLITLSKTTGSSIIISASATTLGDATITATTPSGAFADFSAHIKSLRLEPSSGEISATSQLKLEALMDPGGEPVTSKLINWTFDPTTVATISPENELYSLPTAVAADTVDVTTTSTYGNIISDIATYTFVTNKILRFDQGSSDFFSSNEIRQLSFTLDGSPVASTDPYFSWSSAIPTTLDKATTAANFDDGKVTVLGIGDTTITATYNDTVNPASSASFTVKARDLVIDQSNLQVKIGQSVKLTASLVSPAGSSVVTGSTPLVWEVIKPTGLLDSLLYALLSGADINQDGMMSLPGLVGLGILAVGLPVDVKVSLASNPAITTTKTLIIAKVL
jgi:hypothetical protein